MPFSWHTANNGQFAVCPVLAHGELAVQGWPYGHFAVCQGLGTRQSDHMASPGHQVRRVPRPCTRRTDHTLPCTKTKGTRRRLDVHRVSTTQAYGKQPPTPSAGRDSVCSLFFAVRLYIHTANRFAVCPTFGTRGTRSLPSPWLPSGLCRRPPSAKSSLCASGTRRTRGLR